MTCALMQLSPKVFDWGWRKDSDPGHLFVLRTYRGVVALFNTALSKPATIIVAVNYIKSG